MNMKVTLKIGEYSGYPYPTPYMAIGLGLCPCKFCISGWLSMNSDGDIERCQDNCISFKYYISFLNANNKVLDK